MMKLITKIFEKFLIGVSEHKLWDLQQDMADLKAILIFAEDTVGCDLIPATIVTQVSDPLLYPLAYVLSYAFVLLPPLE